MIKYRISQEMIHTVVEKNTISGSIAPETTCFALLGSDLLIDEMANLMSVIHTQLWVGEQCRKFHPRCLVNLIEETLSILLLNGNEKETSFDTLVVG